MSDGFNMIFTAVRDGETNAAEGVQMLAHRDDETLTSRLLPPATFLELMLASHIYPPNAAAKLFSRVCAECQITEKNVMLTGEDISFFRLTALR